MRRTFELGHLPAVVRRDQGHHLVVRQPDFLPPVEIEVVGRRLDPSLRLSDGSIEQIVGGDQVLIDGVAQMGQIDAAERAVPIAAIALAAVQLGAGLFEQLGIHRLARGHRRDGLL